MGTILKNGINYSGTSGGGGVSSYNELTEKPKINNVTLSGNKTTADLAISYNDLTDKPIIPTGGDYYETGDAAETALADGDYFPFQDVSANGRRKTLWSNIKSVLKTYFDTLYNKVTAGTGLSLSSNTMSIKQFASGDMDEVIPELPSVGARYHKYSTEEQIVGTWIDGKPVYEKTFTGELSSTSIGSEIATYINMGATIDTYVEIFGFALSSSGRCHMIPTARFLQSEYRWIRVSANSNSASTNANVVALYNAWGSTYNTYIITVQYTKTT